MQKEYEGAYDVSMPGLRLRLMQDFAAPKRGRSESEYEDARTASSHCMAIADGAAESSFAGIWAQGLVSEYIATQPDKNNIFNWLDPLQNKWSATISAMSLPWYAEEKAAYGAFASLAGIRLSGGLNWSAFAVGDSCIFLVREESLCLAFPLTQSGEFGNTPGLISSKPIKNRNLSAFIRETSGTCEIGDLFFLATDALACWFLQAVEAGLQPWRMLSALENYDAFLQFLEEERARQRIRNDDVTLLIASVSRENNDDIPNVA